MGKCSTPIELNSSIKNTCSSLVVFRTKTRFSALQNGRNVLRMMRLRPSPLAIISNVSSSIRFTSNSFSYSNDFTKAIFTLKLNKQSSRAYVYEALPHVCRMCANPCRLIFKLCNYTSRQQYKNKHFVKESCRKSRHFIKISYLRQENVKNC